MFLNLFTEARPKPEVSPGKISKQIDKTIGSFDKASVKLTGDKRGYIVYVFGDTTNSTFTNQIEGLKSWLDENAGKVSVFKYSDTVPDGKTYAYMLISSYKTKV